MSLIFGPHHIPVVIAAGRPRRRRVKPGVGRGVVWRPGACLGKELEAQKAQHGTSGEGRAATGETQEDQGSRIPRIHTAWTLWMVEKTEGTKGTKALPCEEETDSHKES